MLKKNSDVTHRAWNLLRLALLWARKGGVFKRRLFPKFIKSLGHAAPTDQLHYEERELSFDKTPIFHVKMHRPASMRYLIPCVTPQVDFDHDFDDGDDYQDGGYGYDIYGRKSFLKNGEEEEEGEGEYEYDDVEENIPIEEQGIDLRAEEFIAKFYQQIKMQRQISYLKYNERLRNTASS